MDVGKIPYSRSRRESRRPQEHDSSSTRNSPRKRSYQREQNPRRGNRNAEEIPNDDLRSPCHKHPRFKAQKENTPDNNLMSNGKKKGPWKQKLDENTLEKLELNKGDFPPLGINLERYTPEPAKDWGSIVQEEEVAQCKDNSSKPLKFKRRLLLSNSNDTTIKDTNNKQTSNDKSKAKNKVLRPIITDPHKLAQRQKQIDIGKNTVSYGQYIKNVQRENRSKDDPWTPDKFQQCSTRSWVGQVKVWRRRLHSYDLSSETQEDLFSTSSTSSSQAAEDIKMDAEEIPPTSSQNSIEDMFKDFDLDSCLIEDDGFPL